MIAWPDDPNLLVVHEPPDQTVATYPRLKSRAARAPTNRGAVARSSKENALDSIF
jgi:hypothetical protein